MLSFINVRKIPECLLSLIMSAIGIAIGVLINLHIVAVITAPLLLGWLLRRLNLDWIFLLAMAAGLMFGSLINFIADINDLAGSIHKLWFTYVNDLTNRQRALCIIIPGLLLFSAASRDIVSRIRKRKAARK